MNAGADPARALGEQVVAALERDVGKEQFGLDGEHEAQRVVLQQVARTDRDDRGGGAGEIVGIIGGDQHRGREAVGFASRRPR